MTNGTCSSFPLLLPPLPTGQRWVDLVGVGRESSWCRSDLASDERESSRHRADPIGIVRIESVSSGSSQRRADPVGVWWI
jgi:hypothetical protein